MWLLTAGAVYGVMSVLTLTAFAIDKRAARAGTERIAERTLHAMELLGGWPGALVGMRLVRHKWRKRGYVGTLAAIVTAHVGAWAWAGWACWR